MAETAQKQPAPQAFESDPLADGIMHALANFANVQMPVCQGFTFTALPPDMSLQNAPTYAVQLHDDEGHLAVTYKYNYFCEGHEWRLCPLVIQWEGNPPRRQPGMDAAIIEHCLSTLRVFFADELKSGKMKMTMATGYLTVQRHGHAFFERMGWTLYSFTKQNGTYPALAAHSKTLQSITARIEEISMPFRTDDVEANTMSFAVMEI